MTNDATPTLTRDAFVAMVDHTLLKPEATRDQIIAVCDEAVALTTASVCVNSYWTALVAERLAGSGVDVCSVVGFPLGAMNLDGVRAETERAVADGAVEIDMVLPVGLFRTDPDAAGGYIATVAKAAGDALVKVILETALLTDDEIVAACELAVDRGAEFVKTSTGFNPAGGATVEAVRLMRATVGPDIGVKASGGIRTLDDVVAMVDAGASRLGMSATMAIVDQLDA